MRRALGFKLREQARSLHHYVAHLDRIGATTITIESAVAWATQPAEADPWYWKMRVNAIRGFARHMASLDPATEVPPTDLLAARSKRAVPFLYSAADVAALMNAAGRLRTPLTVANYQTVIGLLAVTGMRVGEMIGLDRDDVDRDEGVLVIRDSKFGKSREVAVHPSTLAALEQYALIRDRHCPRPRTKAWFVSNAGTRLIYKNVHRCFHRLTQISGLTRQSPRCHPRIHDLRHAFAVNTLLSWYRAGEDVAAKMPLLSTYLGHVEPGRDLLVSVRDAAAAAAGRAPARPDGTGAAMSTLAPTLQAFFTDRLIRQRNASPHTIAAYRDTMRLLLFFAKQRTAKPTRARPRRSRRDPVAAFLDHLEQRARQQRADPKRPAGRDPLAVPLRRAASPRARRADRARARHPAQTLRQNAHHLPHPPEIDALLAAPDRDDLDRAARPRPAHCSPSRPGCASGTHRPHAARMCTSAPARTCGASAKVASTGPRPSPPRPWPCSRAGSPNIAANPTTRCSHPAPAPE